jgi:hypothetical protein
MILTALWLALEMNTLESQSEFEWPNQKSRQRSFCTERFANLGENVDRHQLSEQRNGLENRRESTTGSELWEYNLEAEK